LFRMPGYGARFWADRTADQRRRSYPVFRGKAAADVVVIGGGLTGCATAYALAAAGRDVVLLEAARLAGGATAGGIGAIIPQPDASYMAVERIAGARTAGTAWRETRRASLELGSVLRKLKIRCDLQPSELLITARTEDEGAALVREQTARKKAGLDAPALSARAARQALGQDTAGAIRLHDAFEFDPVRATLGFAAAASLKGAKVFERSAVKRTRFTRKDAQVILETGGVIQTRGIVVATGEPGALFGQLRRHVHAAEGYVVVTHPLTAAMRRELGPRKGVITEAGSDSHWLRWLPEERILFAGALGAPTNERQRQKLLVQRTAQLMYELSVRYPAISGLPAAWGWHVPVVSTSDRLPWIGAHRNYPHHFFAVATGWEGAGLAWFAAKAAVRHFRDEARREDETFGFGR
jgi:gamma-glutamylputrescine oxidase